MDRSKTKKRLTNKLAWLVNTLIILLFISFNCLFVYQISPKFTTLEDILKAGKITVITRNNANCYYQYRNEAMGFEYDLAKAFADYLGVDLKVQLAEHWKEMIPALMEGTGAFIAASMTITPKRQSQVAFSDGYMTIQQHIIVHRDNPGIKQAEDLNGKTVHVRSGTSYQEQLQVLKNRGINLTIKLYDDLPTEELIRRVANKTIEVTIADSNIALLNRRYYPEIILAGPIGKKERLGWAVNPKAGKLLDRINKFFRIIKKNGKFKKIYNKYYGQVDAFDYVDLRTFHRRLKTRLPRYYPIIKEAAEKQGFDWRLIAAQIYQESHLNPGARSPAGAYGLMQLTPSTARSLGVKNVLDPRENINAGVRYLKSLYDLFDQADGSDRLFIALAAYNIGQGHIFDARNIARRMNLDPNQWSSMTKVLPLLRYRKYYNRAKYGYCRGTEPIKYIKQIMIYYDVLKHQSIARQNENNSFPAEVPSYIPNIPIVAQQKD